MERKVYSFRDPAAENVYLFDAALGVLLEERHGRRIPVTPMQAVILQHLLEEAPRFVRTEKLAEYSGAPGSHAAVRQRIHIIRRLVGDRVIDFVPGHGYRIVAPVQVITEGRDSSQSSAVRSASTSEIEPSEHVAAEADFEIHFDPDFAPDEVRYLLTALADYYRGCGGAGFELDLEAEQATVKEPVHV